MILPFGRPLCIDLFCGLGGWAEGFLTEGYEVIGYDNGECGVELLHQYPGRLVIQDVRTIDGTRLGQAAIIVASPPCNEYSYMAMPWKRGKQIARALQGNDEFPQGYKDSRTIEELNRLFNECFRIQREASEAAGRKIPLIVENVRGAQKWVGRAKWNFGSYYLWGDVPALMPVVVHRMKSNPGTYDRLEGLGEPRFIIEGIKIPGNNGPYMWRDRDINRLKDLPTPFTGNGESSARKQASTLIAKIPFPLAQHIARVFKPEQKGPVREADNLHV